MFSLRIFLPYSLFSLERIIGYAIYSSLWEQIPSFCFKFSKILFSLGDDRLWRRVIDRRMRRNRMHQPDVAADDAVVPDGNIPAENGRPGIDHDVVLDIRVPLDSLDRVSPLIHFKTLCPQRYPLIQLDAVADDAGLPDDDARAVVDKKAAANARAGVNIAIKLR